MSADRRRQRASPLEALHRGLQDGVAAAVAGRPELAEEYYAILDTGGQVVRDVLAGGGSFEAQGGGRGWSRGTPGMECAISLACGRRPGWSAIAPPAGLR